MKDKVINALERIREGLKREGGDIELVDIKGSTVYVKLMGACSTCPMSTLTMKNWVEKTLKQEVPEVDQVLAV
ncbi:MAG: NifU family protein [Nitrospirota bacterium]|nr:MAG: NifU family protein [Nitrospirota bacterium]